MIHFLENLLRDALGFSQNVQKKHQQGNNIGNNDYIRKGKDKTETADVCSSHLIKLLVILQHII